MKRLSSVCLITQDVRRLRDFYASVLELASEGSDSFVTFSTSGADLAIFPTQGLEEMAPGSMHGAGAGNCFLEFEVEAVDKEYERLKALKVKVVKPPTTQPWGLRSVWFRDPDGNMVSFYAPVARSEGNDG